MSKSVQIKIVFCVLVAIFCMPNIYSQKSKAKFKVVAFFSAINEPAHCSFVHEANKWFNQMSVEYHFTYDSTNNWNNLNSQYLSDYQIVIFLDTRPDLPEQRLSFETYMKNGGGWMGFHFSAFALTPSDFPQNWDWYHNQFLGSGQYKSNTWRPTSAILRKHRFSR